MTRWRRLLLLLAALSIAVPAVAQPRPEPTTEDQRKAQEHFQKARDLYQTGNYREAIHELEVAHALDPKARDLVMNLAIVSEKLGKYDDALAYFKTFLEMDGVTPAERSKAEANMKRIEGAKQRDAARHPPPPASAAPSTSVATPPRPTSAPSSSTPKDPPKGRVDGATIAAGAVAGVGLAAGATFGVLALTTRPSDFVTGRDGTYADLQSKTDSAHTFAIVADIALGVGIVAAVATIYLYFGRTKDAAIGLVGPGGIRF